MKTLITLLIALVLLHPSSFILAQGPLTPPGAPAATMKTLQQIEPRTDLQATPAPVGVDTTNAAYHFIINQPGSYYLSANLGVTKTNGIQINAEGVRLDLNGFEISRASGIGGNGIEIPAIGNRAAVRNGSLKGFQFGIRSVFSTAYAKGCAFRDLAVSGCTSYGILAGRTAVLEACRAHDNSGSFGIYASNGCTLSHCTVSSNTASYGIYADTGSTLSDCAAHSNTATYGILASTGSTLSHCAASFNNGSYGIYADIGSTLSHCAVYGNAGSGIYASLDSSVLDCIATGNSTHGIEAGARVKIHGCSANGNGTGTTGSGITTDIRAMVTDCSASSNQKSGIVVLGDSSVRDCRASLNGRGVAAAGIDSAGGNGSRIEGNQARDNNGTGVLAAGGDIVIRNSAGSNTTNFNPAAGANFAPIQSPSTATNPLANIVF